MITISVEDLELLLENERLNGRVDIDPVVSPEDMAWIRANVDAIHDARDRLELAKGGGQQLNQEEPMRSALLRIITVADFGLKASKS